MKLINYRELSRILTGKTTTIRANSIPERYKERLKELENIINYWLSKNKNI